MEGPRGKHEGGFVLWRGPKGNSEWGSVPWRVPKESTEGVCAVEGSKGKY